jgi:ADP-heptose:LPS heptosyltransferase
MIDPILVFRIGSMGDTIFALPCFHAIRQRYANRRIVLLTNVPVSGVAAPLMSILGQDGQFADDLIEYPISLRNFSGLAALRKKIHASGAKEAVYLMPERSRTSVWRDWLFLRSSGISKVHCLPDSDDLRFCRRDPKTGEVEREASRLARCSAAFGHIDLNDRKNWDLRLTAAELACGREIRQPFGSRPFVAVNMGGKAAEKDWGLDNWSTLRELLAKLGPVGLMIVGAKEDAERADSFLDGWTGVGVNACGRLSPRESAAALRGAALFIGHDSGPLHMASAEGVPSIGLFGNYNEPCRWHPIGSHVRIIHRMEGLDRISPQEVYDLSAVLMGATKEFL